jgi:hypothetical protein
MVSGFFVNATSDLKGAVQALQVQAAQLQTTVTDSVRAQSPESHSAAARNLAGESSDALEDLRKEMTRLTATVTELQRTLNRMANARRADKDSSGVAPAAHPFPELAPPRFGGSPDNLMRWRAQASSEKRELVDRVMRETAARAREKIQTQSLDPMRPDLEVVSRVMQETQDEIDAQLSDVLPREDIEALLQPEPVQGMLPGLPLNPR